GAEETAAEIVALGRRAVVVSADLADAGDCRRLIAEAPAPLTLLVNSASLFEDDLIQTLTPEAWDAAQAVNIRAPVLLSQAFAAALPAGQAGLIVNIIDQRVLRLTPQFFSYAVSKAALWAATQMLAQGLAPRIRVNAIAPGPTLASVHQSPADFAAEARAVPLGHGPTPEEIGQALAYLIDAPSVTGQMIAVDGGQHLSWKPPDIVG
ncbi:MAG TPA: SDR family oxidoreductase, partial [Caulobacteraceae bacterium]|nr:SDR family oxidoreductase [Caulobacteraceae bacterium]